MCTTNRDSQTEWFIRETPKSSKQWRTELMGGMIKRCLVMIWSFGTVGISGNHLQQQLTTSLWLSRLLTAGTEDTLYALSLPRHHPHIDSVSSSYIHFTYIHSPHTSRYVCSTRVQIQTTTPLHRCAPNPENLFVFE